MKLISCYIESFGKYTEQRFSFESGLTSYCLPNGEGKTTLAVFLRAMLYGMDTDRGDAYGERSQYYPFQGGNYGGWLQVEWGGKQYKISRTFDKKSAAKDLLSVVDERNHPCDDLGETPGERMFGLTKQAFERTSYITWKQMDFDLCDGIGQRLCGLVSDDTSVGAEAAAEALENYAKTYHSGRKKAGVYTGYLPENEAKIVETQQEIYAAQRAETELVTLREQYEPYRTEEAVLTEKLEKLQAAAVQRGRWEQYQLLLASAAEEQEKAALLEKTYPNGFPIEEELASLKASVQETMLLRQRLSDRSFGKEKELAESEAQFDFAGVPTPERMETIERLVDEYLQASTATVQPKSSGMLQGTRPMKMISSLISSVIMLGIGWRYRTWNQQLSTMMLIFGGIGVALASLKLFLKYRSNKKSKAESAPSAQLLELKSRLEDYFWEYGVRIGDFAAALRTLKADVRRLETLREEKAAYERETQALRERLSECEASLKALLEKYGLTEETWQDAGSAAKGYAEALRAHKEKSCRAEEYKEKYSVTPPTAEEADEEEQTKLCLRSVQEELRKLSGEMQRLEEQIAKIPQLNHQLADLKELQEKLQEEKELIEITAAAMRTADERLKDTYLLPMQKSFLRFAKQMGAEWADTVSLDGDLNIFFEQRGELRREEHFSDGQKALAALCMRLALLENMYEGEAPFCILDDPFVHLDEKHLQEVSKALKGLSSQMQIVYFTCHNTRMI